MSRLLDYLSERFHLFRHYEENWDDPCFYCAPRKNLPRSAPEGTFTVHDHGIWHKSHGQWECVDIDYCPMCGRYLDEEEEP